MRSKEFANDYRYFPEPDLLPVVISNQEMQDIKEIERIPNDQSRKRKDHAYQKMILRVLNEVFPER